MSNITLAPNATGTAIFTVAAPATNTDRTLTLPDATTTLVGTDATQTLTNKTISTPAGSVSAPSIYPTGNANTGIFFPATNTVAVSNNGVESMRIDASGNVAFAIGTITGTGVIKSNGTGSSYASMNGASVDGANIQLNRGGASNQNAYISQYQGSLYLKNLDSGAFIFTNTTSDTERMRIDASGNVSINTLSGTGSRAVNASATGVLSAASDSRLKQEVFTEQIPGLAEIMRLEPKAYKWLDDIENRGENAAIEIGFFADQVKPIIPSAAPMGNDGYFGFYDRAVTAALTKAVQEQQAIIVALEARIAALEAK